MKTWYITFLLFYPDMTVLKRIIYELYKKLYFHVMILKVFVVYNETDKIYQCNEEVN